METMHIHTESQMWSEHYRGFDFEILDYPPLKILNQRYDSAKFLVENNTTTMERLEKQIQEHPDNKEE